MNKRILFAAALVLALFGAITLLKSRPASEHAPEAGEATAAEKENVQRFWAVYRRATDLRMAGRPAEAAAAYRQALALNDRHEDAWYYLGNMYLEQGAFAGAQRAWQRLAHLNPNSARAYAQLGAVHLCVAKADTLFDLDAAEAAFARAHQINREETGPLLRLGQVALLRGDLERAQDYFEAVTGSNYRSVEAYVLHGYVAWKQGDAPRATALLAQAAAHARPEAPAGGVAGEGDTKQGSGAMVSEASQCEVFQPFIDELARGPAADSGVDRRYRKLDAFLSQVRMNKDF